MSSDLNNNFNTDIYKTDKLKKLHISVSLLITYKWTIGGKSTNHLVLEKYKLKSGKNIKINLDNDTKIL